jgi:preprotein translocase subunit SecD
MLKRTLLCILLAGSCGLMAVAQAQQFIYKWMDEQGQPKYSELLPPPGIPYETVRKPGDEAPGVATKDLAKEQEELARKLAEEEAKTQEQQEQAQKEATDARAKNCEIARKNVEVLQGDRPVVRTDDKGNKVALDAAQREAELQKAKKDQDYFCNP